MIEKKILECPRFYILGKSWSSCQHVLNENEIINQLNSVFLGRNPCTSTYFWNMQKWREIFQVIWCSIESQIPFRFSGSLLYDVSLNGFQIIIHELKIWLRCKSQISNDQMHRWTRAAQVSRNITLDQYNLISRQHFNRLVIRDEQ